jgi:hypothetical protein
VDRDDAHGSRQAKIGLCADCQFARAMNSAKGSEFWRCGRADEDEGFLKYPPLPVRVCEGFQAN